MLHGQYPFPDTIEAQIKKCYQSSNILTEQMTEEQRKIGKEREFTSIEMLTN